MSAFRGSPSGPIAFAGITVRVKRVNTPYVFEDGVTMVFADASFGSNTVDLPPIASVTRDLGGGFLEAEARIVTVADSAPVVIRAATGELVQGAASITLSSDGQSVILVPVSESAWVIVSDFDPGGP